MSNDKSVEQLDIEIAATTEFLLNYDGPKTESHEVIKDFLMASLEMRQATIRLRELDALDE